MVDSDPCKFQPKFHKFSVKVSVFFKVRKYKVFENIAAYKRFQG